MRYLKYKIGGKIAKYSDTDALVLTKVFKDAFIESNKKDYEGQNTKQPKAI